MLHTSGESIFLPGIFIYIWEREKGGEKERGILRCLCTAISIIYIKGKKYTYITFGFILNRFLGFGIIHDTKV